MTSPTSKSQPFGATSWSLFSSTIILHQSATRKSQQMVAVLPRQRQHASDLLKSLLEPQEKIPHGNASCVAFVNYVYRALQIMICESGLCKHQLMWDPKHQSWRLVFAFLPGSRTSPPTFFKTTWKINQQGVANDEYSSGKTCSRI